MTSTFTNNLIYSLLFTVIYSCSSDHKTASPGKNDFVKDIPESFNSESYLKSKKATEKFLGIQSIENGFSDLQIRIIRGYGHSDSLNLVLLKKSNSVWSGKVYHSRLQYNKSYDSVINGTKTENNIQPKSGWIIFIDSLFSLQILDLPNYNKIPGYFLSNDADALTVELSSPNKYRIYTYPNFSIHKEKIDQAKKISQIKDLISSELNLDW